jgi:hypothetical protein
MDTDIGRRGAGGGAGGGGDDDDDDDLTVARSCFGGKPPGYLHSLNSSIMTHASV